MPWLYIGRKNLKRAGVGSFILSEIHHSIYRYIYAMRGGKEEEIKCTYEVYEKYCKAFQEMKDKAGSYTPTENEIYQRIYPELEKYILFLLWIEMTGYDTEENKKNRQIICTILKEELKLVEKEELEEE